jgi:hypothetical protein
MNNWDKLKWYTADSDWSVVNERQSISNNISNGKWMKRSVQRSNEIIVKKE